MPQKIARKSICSFLPAAAIFVMATLLAYPQSEGGGYAESYIYRNVGARPTAMAGAYTAVVNEPGAVFYNPAGLGFLSGIPTITSTVSVPGMGRTQTSIAYAQEIYERIGIGFGINGFLTDEFTQRDISGAEIGAISGIQYEMAMAAGYRINFMSMGLAVKYLTNSLVGTHISGSGFGVDLGTKFDVLNMFSVGISVRNLSGMMFWNNVREDREDLPFSVRMGIAMEYGFNEQNYRTRNPVTGEIETIFEPATRYILFAADAIFIQHEMTPNLVIGTEFAAHEIIAFRGGISVYGEREGEPKILPMNYWGGGASIRPQIETLPFDLHIDYTISGEYLAENGISHHISLLFAF